MNTFFFEAMNTWFQYESIDIGIDGISSDSDKLGKVLELMGW